MRRPQVYNAATAAKVLDLVAQYEALRADALPACAAVDAEQRRIAEAEAAVAEATRAHAAALAATAAKQERVRQEALAQAARDAQAAVGGACARFNLAWGAVSCGDSPAIWMASLFSVA